MGLNVRILQVVASISPHDGGPTTSVLELNRAFRKLGNEAEIISSNYLLPGEVLPYPVNETVDVDGARVTLLPMIPRAPYKWPRGLMRALRERFAVGVDVVIIDGLFLPSVAIAARAARSAGIPYLLQPHGTLDSYDRQSSGVLKRTFDLFLGPELFGGASGIVITSPNEGTEALHDRFRHLLRVIPLGASLQPQEPVDLGERWMTLPRAKRFAYVGRLAKKKRPDLLIDAWAESGVGVSCHLVVAGPDHQFTADELRDRARIRGVSESVTVPGALSPGQAAFLLRNSGTFVLPTERENFGIALAEAMFAGCSIITTPGVVLHEQVSQWSAGQVVAIGNAEELAFALHTANRNSSEIEAQGRRAEENSAVRLSWEASAHEYLALVNRL